MEYAVIICFILAAGYFIIHPLLKPVENRDSPHLTGGEGLRELHLRREAAHAAIEELEFDLEMGKLSMESYKALKEQHTLEAAHSMKEIEALKSNRKQKRTQVKRDIIFGLEQEISKMRMSKTMKEKDLL